MDVRVRLAGMIRQIVKESEVQVSVAEGATVEGLLKLLADRYGEKFRERVFAKDNQLSRAVKIFVNDQASDGPGQILAAAGRGPLVVSVVVLSAVAGG